jgi:hypothetical protein
MPFALVHYAWLAPALQRPPMLNRPLFSCLVSQRVLDWHSL